MDMEFSAPVHVDGALVVEVIDNAWASDSLPVDDIEVPAAAVTPLDDDDFAPPFEEVTAHDQKWTDLALDLLTADAH